MSNRNGYNILKTLRHRRHEMMRRLERQQRKLEAERAEKARKDAEFDRQLRDWGRQCGGFLHCMAEEIRLSSPFGVDRVVVDDAGNLCNESSPYASMASLELVNSWLGNGHALTLASYAPAPRQCLPSGGDVMAIASSQALETMHAIEDARRIPGSLASDQESEGFTVVGGSKLVQQSVRVIMDDPMEREIIDSTSRLFGDGGRIYMASSHEKYCVHPLRVDSPETRRDIPETLP